MVWVGRRRPGWPGVVTPAPLRPAGFACHVSRTPRRQHRCTRGRCDHGSRGSRWHSAGSGACPDSMWPERLRSVFMDSWVCWAQKHPQDFQGTSRWGSAKGPGGGGGQDKAGTHHVAGLGRPGHLGRGRGREPCGWSGVWGGRGQGLAWTAALCAKPGPRSSAWWHLTSIFASCTFCPVSNSEGVSSRCSRALPFLPAA